MLDSTLESVMTQGFLYVREEEAAGKALGVMRDMRISCVFVMAGDAPVGIVTERGVVEKALEGMDMFTMGVREVMSAPLVTIAKDASIKEACETMRDREIRHLGVVDSRSLLKGVVTPGNIVGVMGTDSFSSTALAGDIMSTSLVVLDQQSTLHEAAVQMIGKRSCCALAMDGDRLAGMVSERDIARHVSYGGNIARTPLAAVMSSPVVALKTKDSMADAIIALRQHRIRRMPVLDENGAVKGVLSQNNLVQHINQVVTPELRCAN